MEIGCGRGASRELRAPELNIFRRPKCDGLCHRRFASRWLSVKVKALEMFESIQQTRYLGCWTCTPITRGFYLQIYSQVLHVGEQSRRLDRVIRQLLE